MSKIYDESAVYLSHKSRWSLIDALMGGTTSMRGQGKTYLPKDEMETPEDYKTRKSRSVLFNALKRTLRNLTGKPFSKPVELTKADEDIKTWWKDIDRQGTHGDLFAKTVFEQAVAKGVTYIYVDYPNVAKVDGDGNPVKETITLDEQRKKNIRPYFVHIRVEDIIGWRSENIDGRTVATQVRIRRTVEEPDGKYGTKLVKQVLLLEPGKFEVWEIKEVVSENAKGVSNPIKDGTQAVTTEPKMVDHGTTTLKEIPLVPIYGRKVAFMQGESPLNDVADLNVSHWQKLSDQDNILHAARVPILFGKGFAPPGGEKENAFVIGAHRSILTTNTDADVKYVEHTGKAIEAGRIDLEDLENRMRLMGLEMLIKKQAVTATERRSDDNMLDSELASIVRGLETGLGTAFKFAKAWIEQVIEPPTFSINKDYGITAEEATNLEHLYRARQSNEITQETYLSELVRRGVISHTLNIAAEIDKTELSKPKEGMVDDDFDEDDDEDKE